MQNNHLDITEGSEDIEITAIFIETDPDVDDFAGYEQEKEAHMVTNSEELDNIRDHIEKSFILVYDIDFQNIDLQENENWEPIGDFHDWGNYSAFTGSFDGRKNKLKI